MNLLRSTRAMPKPLLAQTILVATSAFVMSVLSIWLAFWLFFVRPDLNVCAIWVGPSPTVAATTALFYQENDARLFGSKAMKKPENPSKLAESIRLFLESKGQRPAIVYLSIPGVGRLRDTSPSDPADGTHGFPIDPEVIAGARDFGRGVKETDLADVLDQFRRRPWQKKLLILDIGQVDTDRDLGVFANDFTNRLKQELDKNALENFTVLCSCAPGQASWSSDADRRTVFAHYVADGMTRARDVQELVVYVKKRVYQWVKAQRGAIQTPIAWESPTSNFLLPKPPGEPGVFWNWGTTPEPTDSPWQTPEARDLWNRLVACYQSRDAFADQRPYRFAPLAWREYQETLLRAERLYRAGLFPACADVIRTVDGLEQELKNPCAALSESGYPSVEMGLQIASDSGFHPRWASEREWQRALDWPFTPNAPELPEKPKASDAAKKQGGGIVSSEIAEKPAPAPQENGSRSFPRLWA